MRIDRFSKILVLSGLCFLFVGGLFTAVAQDVIRASGGTDLSIDNINGSYSTLSGPTIRETASGQLADNGTIQLTLPNGYEWNTALTGGDITLTIDPQVPQLLV